MGPSTRAMHAHAKAILDIPPIVHLIGVEFKGRGISVYGYDKRGGIVSYRIKPQALLRLLNQNPEWRKD